MRQECYRKRAIDTRMNFFAFFLEEISHTSTIIAAVPNLLIGKKITIAKDIVLTKVYQKS